MTNDSPSVEDNVMGARDGFIEVVRVNLSHASTAKNTSAKVGVICQGNQKSNRDLSFLYGGSCTQKLITQIKSQLDQMKLESILSSGYV